MRLFAVDWSGAAQGAGESMWLAEADSSGLRRLENGRGRNELAEFLIAEKAEGEPMVIGLDFAFSVPAWFVREQGGTAPALWERCADGWAEAWLRACDPPFWGRPGKKKPRDRELFRHTDGLSIAGISPKSVFQIGGAGAVGTGSLRGMAVLHRLRAAGFSVWPFTEPGAHTLIEIYPRALTGPVNKSSHAERSRYLDSRFPQLASELRARAASSEDAFDAAVSALIMWEHRSELSALEPTSDPIASLEGQIWHPETPRSGSAGHLPSRSPSSSQRARRPDETIRAAKAPAGGLRDLQTIPSGFATGDEPALARLAALQGLAVAPDLLKVGERLGGPIAQYAELETRTEGGRIDLVTLSRQHQAAEALAAMIAERSSASDAKPIVELARFGAGAALGLKLPVAGALEGGELYVRAPLPMPEVRAYLRRRDVPENVLEALAAAGEALGKEHTHMLSIDAGTPRQYTVFFTTFLDPATGPAAEEAAIRGALGAVEVPVRGVEAALACHELLGGGRGTTLYVSAKIREGELLGAASLHYESARVGLLEEVVDLAAIEPAGRPLRWAEALGARKANYAGVVVDANGVRSLRAYFRKRQRPRRR